MRQPTLCPLMTGTSAALANFSSVQILVEKTNVVMKDFSDQKIHKSPREQGEPVCILFGMHLASCHGCGMLALQKFLFSSCWVVCCITPRLAYFFMLCSATKENDQLVYLFLSVI
jgi:hypothetical protein